MRWYFFLLIALSLRLPAQTEKPPADSWLTNTVVPLPSSAPADSNAFASLRAESISGKISIRWQPPLVDTNLAATLIFSCEAPGHWPARDWHRQPLLLHSNLWIAHLPVDDVDVPLIYCVESQTGNLTNRSPLRICHPREAGLVEPSRAFWPFLEGFEEGLDHWRLLSTGGDYPALHIGQDQPRRGNGALVVSLPAGKHSVSIGTTLVRGWAVENFMATGVRVWLRTRAGSGQARFALWMNAFSPEQSIVPGTNVVALGPQWQKIDLSFRSFPNLQRPDIDFFTLEFTGDGPQEFWVDEISLLGRWRLELE